MQSRLVFISIIAAVVLAACNLGGSGEEATITPQTTQAVSVPQIQIISPSNGANYTVNEQVIVRVQATDAIGVTRAQLFANGQIVRTISSTSATGDTVFSGELDFSPRTIGAYQLQVIAYRQVVASNPVEITINVSEDNIVVTTRPTDSNNGGGDSGPIIPNDGVCRALLGVNLNFRTEPTTSRENVITTLPAQTLAPVIGRLSDNSWWKILANNQIGWVSGNPSYTTLYGNCGAVPIDNVAINTATPIPTNPPAPTNTSVPTNTPLPSITPTPGRPDLVITNISGNREVLIPAGDTSITLTYALTVTNQGVGGTGQFEVVMRFDGNEYPFVVGNLNRNESIVLTQDLTFNGAGSYDIRVDADPTNVIPEISDVNNRGDTTVIVEQGT